MVFGRISEEMPRYAVVHKGANFQIRRYEPSIAVMTEAQGLGGGTDSYISACVKTTLLSPISPRVMTALRRLVLLSALDVTLGGRAFDDAWEGWTDRLGLTFSDDCQETRGLCAPRPSRPPAPHASTTQCACDLSGLPSTHGPSRGSPGVVGGSAVHTARPRR
jgi:hypothetical protein